MIVKDILTMAKTRLSNLAIAKNDEALILFLNLGLGELYRRFNLAIKSEVVLTNPDLALYELRNKDVSLFLTLYDKHGNELHQTDILNSNEWDYKLVNYKSFTLKKPTNNTLYAIYKASPAELKDMEDEIDVPNAMIEALLSYVSYMGHSTVTTQTSVLSRGQSEADIHYDRFLAACNELEMQGYKIPLNTETLAINFKGFV